MKKLIIFSFIFSLFFLAGTLVWGAENNNQNQEIIAGNLFRVGNKIEISSPVNGDVIFAGGIVEILAPVAGDVLGAGGIVRIKGDVLGNVRVIAESVEITGIVERNINVFANKLIIKDSARIGRDIYLGVNNAEIAGEIEGNLSGNLGNLILSGKIKKNVDLVIQRAGKVILEPQALISGDLIYRATLKNQLQKKDGAQILGQTSPKIFQTQKTKFIAAYIFGKIIALFGLLIVGLVLLSLAPRKTLEIKEKMFSQPFYYFWRGLIYLIVTPILILILFLTVIGIPLAMILGAIYLVGLYLSQVLAGIALGFFAVSLAAGRSFQGSLLWPMVLGMVLLIILINLPFVGGIIKVILILWAFGALINIFRETIKEIG